MPNISIYFGFVIRMNFFDHAPPHLHAAYNETPRPCSTSARAM
ncbi:MAG: hypothetical protein ACRED4_05955 [Brevundimonas sp.]